MAQTNVGNTTGQANDYPVDMNAGAATDDTQRIILAIDSPGAKWPVATTVVDVSLASSATSAELLAANTARVGLTLTNTDANAVYPGDARQLLVVDRAE